MSEVAEYVSAVAALRGERGTPQWVQIFSIPCSFGENLAKLYVGIPPGGLTPPPLGNPGPATGQDGNKLKFPSESDGIII